MAKWIEALKKYVPQEQHEEAIEEMKKELVFDWKPADVYNEKANEAKTLKAQLDEHKKQIESLSEKAGSLEEYQGMVEKLKADYAELETKTQTEIANITKKTKTQELLTDLGLHKKARDLILKDSEFLDKIEIENGKIKNAEEITKQITDEMGDLIVTKTQETETGREKGQNDQQKQPKDMTSEEYMKWYEERESNRKTL